jgi:lysophospholipase L1-like esterase
MKNLKYIYLSFGILALTACNDPEDVDLTPEVMVEEQVELTAASTDFSNYVALGASFTAGYTDGALFKAGQESSFPKLLSNQFALVGGGEFSQPLMNDNTGAFLGVPTSAVGYRLIFNGSGPQRLNEFFAGLGAPVPSPTTNPTVNVGTVNNVGVPGAKSYHMVAPGYAAANPYYARFATSASSTMSGDAASQGPSFFTLSEVGGNDVLSYATSGGVGEDRTGNPNAAEYSQLDITDPGLFSQVFQGIIAQLTANGAQGAVANLPNITDLPYFTSIPNNALVLDTGTAANLTGFFQAVTGIFTQGLIQQGVPPANAQALAAQYAITFQEGPNRFLIDVPVSQANPLGFRQMTEEELLLLPIDRGALAQGYGSVVLTPDVLQVLGLLQTGGTPTQQQARLVLAAVSGIDDKDALDSEELLNIKNATDAYNATIESVTTAAGLAFVDLKSVLENAKANGVQSNGYTLNTSLVTGGLVSLDGVHLTSRGYAVMANEFMKAIDATYGSNFEASGNLLNVGDYPTNYSPTLQ